MTDWKNYEEVAQALLNEFRLDFGLDRVEGKQSLMGERTGTSWEIDALGFNGIGNRVLVECRRHLNSRQSQEDLAAVAFRILDLNADGAIIVSPLGLQSGAKLVARSEKILSVELDPNSTVRDFTMKFLNRIYAGMWATVTATATMSAEVGKICVACKTFVPATAEACPTCATTAAAVTTAP